MALSFRSAVGPNHELGYCYTDEAGNQAPTLRINPGDTLILKLKNELPDRSPPTHSWLPKSFTNVARPCASFSLAMDASSTNLHFHGFMIPPTCHEDDVLNTSIGPGAEFEYRVRIPSGLPPGLYWYHPHLHGHTEEQVLGGASGALIVEGIERFNRQLAGLAERLLIIRDQARLTLNPVESNPKVPAKDLSVNFIPVPYPEYPAATIQTRPGQHELWRVLNASADTLLDLRWLKNGTWQKVGLVALDGVPLGYASGKADLIEWTDHVALTPGGRAEFLFDAPAKGELEQLLTSGVDTNPFSDDEDAPVAAAGAFAPASSPSDDDDYTPPRWLAKVVSSENAPEEAHISKFIAPGERKRLATPTLPSSLSDVRPLRQRKLYFSEKALDAKNPRTSTVFYLTEEGKEPAAFDPAADPNITVHSGDVEDWTIENRSQEVHTFHIHQTHFMVLERDHDRSHEDYLRDTVAVPYWDGVSTDYPSVKLRMDFRDPAIVGIFPYHCHILQHEDGGMMGTIRVLKAEKKK